MTYDSKQYKLRKKDFVLIKGWLDYTNRVDSPPAIDIKTDLQNLGRTFLLTAYNMTLITIPVMGTWKGLEFLMTN